jgi:hypothetical protein
MKINLNFGGSPSGRLEKRGRGKKPVKKKGVND